uniref:Translation initiation factor IF-2 n=1 Tax=Meloidogyne hapla TaxID=6305 RepID=A0A1I8BIN6_MELHA
MGNTVTKLSINNINLTPGNVLIEVDRVDADDAQSMEKGDGQIGRVVRVSSISAPPYPQATSFTGHLKPGDEVHVFSY